MLSTTANTSQEDGLAYVLCFNKAVCEAKETASIQPLYNKWRRLSQTPGRSRSAWHYRVVFSDFARHIRHAVAKARLVLSYAMAMICYDSG
jgi:hypothetical protein